jgi:hypothetical protein
LGDGKGRVRRSSWWEELARAADSGDGAVSQRQEGRRRECWLAEAVVDGCEWVTVIAMTGGDVVAAARVPILPQPGQDVERAMYRVQEGWLAGPS